MPTISKHFHLLFLKHLLVATRANKNFDEKKMCTGSLVAFFSMKADKIIHFFIFWYKSVDKNLLFSEKDTLHTLYSCTVIVWWLFSPSNIWSVCFRAPFWRYFMIFPCQKCWSSWRTTRAFQSYFVVIIYITKQCTFLWSLWSLYQNFFSWL